MRLQLQSLPTVIILLTGCLCVCSAATWVVEFSSTELSIVMERHGYENVTITGLNYNEFVTQQYELHFKIDNNDIAKVNRIIKSNEILSDGSWKGEIEVYGEFLGRTYAFVELVKQQSNNNERSDNSLAVVVKRETRAIDHVFTGSVATLVGLLYINFGAALDLPKLKSIIRKPIGPAIGFFGQFVIMPLLSFGLGHLIFPSAPEMILGMFFTGVSPAGGASNIWTIILGGNLDLSITMTTISTLAAFGMMPLWIFTLGKLIFDKAKLDVPYTNIASYAAALVGPLIIGLLIQRCFPRVARILVRILKPLSVILILFIIIFAIVTNLYLFQLFSWQIIIAGLGLPWLGYVLGWICAKILRQNPADCLTIAIETGIQNTGLSIFLLRFSLEQPEGDLTTIIPVCVAIMTPVPLTCLYIYQLIKRRIDAKRGDTLLPKAKDPSMLDGEANNNNLRTSGEINYQN